MSNNINNFSLSGIGSSVRYGKSNGIISFGTGGFGIYDATGTVLGNLSLANATAPQHAVTQSQLYALVGSTALSGANGISFSNGTISALFDGSTVVLNGSGKLSVGTITDSNVASGANIALNKLAALGAGSVLVSNGSGVISASSVTATTLGYLDATSSIQSQFNAIGTTYLPLTGGTVTGPIISTAVPTLSSQLVNKSYVDALAAGIDAKQAVATVALANISLTGLQTINGYTTIAGDRILVAGQTSSVDNGIYIASATAWTRSTDMAAASVADGAFTFVSEGTYAGKGYVVYSTNSVVGTNPITWTQFSEAGAYTAGSGLSLNSAGVPQIFSVNLGSNSGLSVSTGPLVLNIASLAAGSTIGSADLIALSQSGSTVYTTVGSLAAEIAQSSVTGVGAISVSSGVISLLTDGEFQQNGALLSLGDITPTSITTSGTVAIGSDLTVTGNLNVNGPFTTVNDLNVVGPDGLEVTSDLVVGGNGSFANINVSGDIVATGNITGANLTNTNTGDQTITLTGDVTSGPMTNGSFATTLANSGVTAGTYGDSSHFATFTVDAKGRLTQAGTFDISSLGTGSVTSVNASGTNGVIVSGGPITNSGVLSITLGDITPSSVTSTGTLSGSNLSGTNTGDNTAGNGISIIGGAITAEVDGTTIAWSGGSGALMATGSFNSAVNATGTISASNFSGASSGTNTGDDTAGSGISIVGHVVTALIDGSTLLYSGGSGAIYASGAFGSLPVNTTGTISASNFSGASSGTNTGDVFAGTALSEDGSNNFNVNVDGTSIVVNSNALTLANSGVTAGTGYNTFTVDAKGRITSASTVTTGTGSVTSVAVAGLDGINVSGSPITDNGTISLSLGDITPTSIDSTGTMTLNGGTGASGYTATITSPGNGLLVQSNSSTHLDLISCTPNSNGMAFAGYKSRGTIGSYQPVQTGDAGMNFQAAFNVASGATLTSALGAAIIAQVSTNYSGAGAPCTSSLPVDLQFYTSANGGTVATQKMVLADNGGLVVGLASSNSNGSGSINVSNGYYVNGTSVIAGLGTGSVKSITAGNGLAGGIITNAGTLSLDFATLSTGTAISGTDLVALSQSGNVVSVTVDTLASAIVDASTPSTAIRASIGTSTNYAPIGALPTVTGKAVYLNTATINIIGTFASSDAGSVGRMILFVDTGSGEPDFSNPDSIIADSAAGDFDFLKVGIYQVQMDEATDWSGATVAMRVWGTGGGNSTTPLTAGSARVTTRFDLV